MLFCTISYQATAKAVLLSLTESKTIKKSFSVIEIILDVKLQLKQTEAAVLKLLKL